MLNPTDYPILTQKDASGNVSTEAQKIFYYISPIYHGEVSQALLYAIGKELDRLEHVVQEFCAQISSDSASWLLDCWEKEYGIESIPGTDDDYRRRQIAMKTNINASFTPYGFARYLEKYVDGTVSIEEFTGMENYEGYHFTIHIDTDKDVNIDDIKEIIDRKKQSHLCYEIKIGSKPFVNISVKSEYTRIGMRFICGMNQNYTTDYYAYPGMYPLPMSRVATCVTEASEAVKAIVCDNFTPYMNELLTVYFLYGNTTNDVSFTIVQGDGTLLSLDVVNATGGIDMINIAPESIKTFRLVGSLVPTDDIDGISAYTFENRKWQMTEDTTYVPDIESNTLISDIVADVEYEGIVTSFKCECTTLRDKQTKDLTTIYAGRNPKDGDILEVMFEYGNSVASIKLYTYSGNGNITAYNVTDSNGSRIIENWNAGTTVTFEFKSPYWVIKSVEEPEN